MQDSAQNFLDSIYHFADIIDKELVVRRLPNKNCFFAEFENCEVRNNKQDVMLRGLFGTGDSPENAIMNYANEISGKILVFNARHENRQEFIVRF